MSGVLPGRVAGSRRPAGPQRRGPVSRRLLRVTRSLRQPHLTLGEVVDDLGPAGLGLVLLVLTLPALIPVPGPFGMTFGTLVALFALQVMCGAQRLWLPPALRRRAAPRRVIRSAVSKALPWLARAEGLLREGRLAWLTGRRARSAFSLPILLMAVTIVLPIPLGNFAPALSLILIALGFISRDGLAVLAGLIAAVAALLWTGLLVTIGADLLQALAAMLPQLSLKP